MIFDHAIEDAVRAGLAEGAAPVRSARRYRGYSNVDLAEACQFSITRMQAIDSGATPSPREIRLLSQALNFPPHALVARV